MKLKINPIIHDRFKSVLQKNILKESQKTTYVLASVSKNIIKIEQELTLE
jgi:hypothetical protein